MDELSMMEKFVLNMLTCIFSQEICTITENIHTTRSIERDLQDYETSNGDGLKRPRPKSKRWL